MPKYINNLSIMIFKRHDINQRQTTMISKSESVISSDDANNAF